MTLLALAVRRISQKLREPADWLFVAGLGALCVALFVTLPREGDIWWMDASRHALNGAFVLDFVKAMPFSHPVDFAFDYYRRLPALTILFYPPLFYVVLALVYSVLGVSEQSALLAELAFLFLLGWGVFRLSRYWLDAPGAFSVAVLTIGAPELYFWGRQVMLDVPAYACLIWAAERHVCYLRSRSGWALLYAAILLDAAIYTKYNAIFFVAVMFVSLICTFGWRAVLDRTVLIAVGVGGFLLLPLMVVFVSFSKYNLEQAYSVAGGAQDRWSIAAWTFYLFTLPEVLSWATVLLAIVGSIYLISRPSARLDRASGVFLIAWFITGYIFYSCIAVKEPRHILFVTFPIVLLAIVFVTRFFSRWPGGAFISILLAVGVLTVTIATKPAPFVTGMREAAQRVAEIAPPDTNVAFFGRLEGTFIYAMRADTTRNDLGVIRLDKVLFNGVAVAMDRGYEENVRTPDELIALLRDLHVQYVVFQTGYLPDLASVRSLNHALLSNKFNQVFHVPMSANYPFTYVTDLLVFRLVEDVPRGRVAPRIEIRLLGRTL